MNYRSRKFLDLAHKINECQLQIASVCEVFSSDGCEPAHSNQSRHGKGMGIKAHDNYHVASCHSCHAELDQGKRYTKQEKRDFWDAGYKRTMHLYECLGYIDSEGKLT